VLLRRVPSSGPMARPSLLLRGSLLVCLAAVAVPSVAAAANPAVDACSGKREGEACGMMKLVKPAGGGELERKTVPGACRSDECCDLDYSKGSPPETVCHACLACKDGPSDLAPPPASTNDPKPAAGGEPPRTAEDGPPPTAPTEQRGCTVSTHPGGPAGWLPGLLVLFVAAVRRRAT
jgi:MYXO-CTERM domain-containing protein